MSKKKYDIAVKTGSYTKDGKEKARWKNVGIVMEADDGGLFILLDRCFNPAGIPFKDGSETVMLSCFDPKDKAPASEPVSNTVEDDIAF